MAEVQSTIAHPKITLIWLNESRAQRIVWLLEELGLDYEIKTFKRKSNMLAPEELKEYHPLGKAPILIVGDQTLAESGFIVEYLIDKYGPKFKPADDDTANYMQYRIANNLSGSFINPNLVANYDYLESLLKDQPFFAGGELTGADILLSFPIESAAGRLGDWYNKEKYPNLYAWLERIRERPAYKKADEKIVTAESNL
ncbi:hypothetical protein ABW20_dc0106912 [Dactylellina cionopaga]|nr:hypothetical protein ABW20_dc0106912 [Dactylellina cionopaga]